MVVADQVDGPAASFAPAVLTGLRIIGDALFQQQARSGDTHLPLL